MTREEAMEIFKDWIDEGVEYDDEYAVRELYEEEKQAVIMAIKALSQEPCEDAVSRADVIELIERGVGNKSVTIDDFTFGKSLMLYHVKQLPSVTQKSGHWIITPFSVIGRHYQCSKCRYIHTFTNFEYCPKCGTCMKDGRTLDEFIEDSKESEK